ncbi:hypothetical protein C7H84_34850 [Burkholderia sp. Nafp2/4-1b]|nr:hypothetical protein C7H84_34850 [Burkholderia sp. Nafp2/4-1b]
MPLIAAFDVGTTSLKAALITRDGNLIHSQTKSVSTWSNELGAIEQEPEQWYRLLAEAAHAWWRRGVDPAHIEMIATAGQMQNLITVDRHGIALGRAMLYADVRASVQADAINDRFGRAELRNTIGGAVTAASLLPKLIFFWNMIPIDLSKRIEYYSAPRTISYTAFAASPSVTGPPRQLLV